ncbi:hypothetical protein ACFQ08_11955 [Streptosporangium algeriense]|uniref:ATP-grasp domain-containing protein n=1 Tax=Streptosporangium algeriense TaxID=1682748 RepID=A0ABW3DNB2_9ACTN
MRFLVLNRNPLSERRFTEWTGPGDRLVLVTDAAALSPDPAVRAEQLRGYEHVEVVEGAYFTAAVERLVVELHARFGFEQIIAMSEFDILRAARIRELLGLEGQTSESALAYRDKLHMKRHLRGAGVPVADFAPVAHLTDLLAFIRQHDFPIVVKPRRAGGSMGVQVLRDEADLWAYVADTPELASEDGAWLLAETYVENDLFHMDGVVLDGKCRLIWPSALTSCLGPQQGEPLVSRLLDRDDPWFQPLVEMTVRALAGLPSPDCFIFHAEVFRTPGNELVFNEVASRMGGGMIEQAFGLAFGITPPEIYVRSVAKTPLLLPEAPEVMTGWALMPPRPGRLVGIPAECPVPGVSAYRTYATRGTVLSSAQLSVDKVASVVVGERTGAEVERVLRAAVSWFEDSVEIAAADGELEA